MRKVYIDGGAHYGDSILAFLGKQTRLGDHFLKRDDASRYEIHAFEPASMLPQLRTLASFLPQIRVIEAALWDADGSVDFSPDGVTGHVMPSGETDDRQIEVPCVRFSRWLRENFAPEDYLVVKLDIEGSEFVVLADLIEQDMIGWIDELYVEWHCSRDEDRFQVLDRHLRGLKTLKHYDDCWP